MHFPSHRIAQPERCATLEPGHIVAFDAVVCSVRPPRSAKSPVCLLVKCLHDPFDARVMLVKLWKWAQDWLDRVNEGGGFAWRGGFTKKLDGRYHPRGGSLVRRETRTVHVLSRRH